MGKLIAFKLPISSKVSLLMQREAPSYFSQDGIVTPAAERHIVEVAMLTRCYRKLLRLRFAALHVDHEDVMDDAKFQRIDMDL